jgi:nucleoside-diphosphate-sugar epimerase
VKVAISGASGFVGRHVVRELLRLGHEVVALQHTASIDASGVRTVVIDIAAPPADAYDRLGRPDTLLHLAWGGLPRYRSLHHFGTELPAHFAFLEQVLRAGLPALAVAGTCFEYGLQSGALHEGLDTAPDNPYALAKDALRRGLQLLQREHQFQLAWARLFYLYGDDQAPQSLYPQLRRAALNGDAEFPMSSGEQLRDYLPVGDVASRLAQLAVRAPNAGIVNVCSGRPVSVRALVERWIAENGWSIRPALGRFPLPDYEPLAFWGDPTKLHATLGMA